METRLSNYTEYKGPLHLKQDKCDMIINGLKELHDIRVGTPLEK